MEKAIIESLSRNEVLGLVQEGCRLLKISLVRGARLGCIELLLDTMTPLQAKALLKAYHNGRLKRVLEKVMFSYHSKPFISII